MKMRFSTFSCSLLLSLSLVEAARLGAGNGGSRQGGAATATLAPQHAGGPPSILPAPLKYHRRQLHGNAFGLDRKKSKRQDPPSDASISPDGQTASMPEPGQSTPAEPDVEDGLPPECEA